MIPLYAGSNDCCRLKQIPGCNRNHLLDPSVIGKKDPSISPLYANDLSNLKKAVIIEAEFDYFRLSNDLFAEKLWDSGIPCEVIRYQGMDHGFYDRLGFCQQTKDCIMEMALQIRKL